MSESLKSGARQNNAAIYKCKVMHERLSPAHHKFQYGIFMLYLDLDDLDSLTSGAIFAVNRQALVSFFESDHFKDGGDGAASTLSTKIRRFAAASGIDEPIASVRLLTMPRIFGYVFNPVSFYFLFDENKNALACVVEVSNTFLEMKMYMVHRQENNLFRLKVPKHFYVSPYAALDDLFDFILAVPEGGKLHISINTVGVDGVSKILLSNLSGRAVPFSTRQIILNFLQYPLLTLKVIALIHFQALLLFLKKIPFSRKEGGAHLQTRVLNPHHKEKSYARAKSQG